jgi:hypothetical protein
MHQPLCHNQTEVEKIGEQGNSFEWRFAIENLKETLTPMSHYGRNNIWLTDIIPWT